MDPGHGLLRALRGAALAACCLVLGFSGHSFGGGGFGLTTPVLAAAALIAAGSIVWADRQRDFRQLLAAAACSQLAFHVTLSLSPDPTTTGHAMQSGTAVVVDPRMLLGHVLGAALMAWVLARGDAVVWGLYRSLHRFVVPRVWVAPLVVDTRPRLSVRPPGGPIIRVGLLLAAAMPHRGPPSALAV